MLRAQLDNVARPALPSSPLGPATEQGCAAGAGLFQQSSERRSLGAGGGSLGAGGELLKQGVSCLCEDRVLPFPNQMTVPDAVSDDYVRVSRLASPLRSEYVFSLAASCVLFLFTLSALGSPKYCNSGEKQVFCFVFPLGFQCPSPALLFGTELNFVSDW